MVKPVVYTGKGLSPLARGNRDAMIGNLPD